MATLLDVFEAREKIILDTPVPVLRDIVVAWLRKRKNGSVRMNALVSQRSLPGILRELESTSFEGETLRTLMGSIRIDTFLQHRYLPVRNQTRRLHHRGGFNRRFFLESIIIGSILYIAHEILTTPSVLLEIPSLRNYLEESVPSIRFFPDSDVINAPEKKLSIIIQFFASLYFMTLIPELIGGNVQINDELVENEPEPAPRYLIRETRDRYLYRLQLYFDHHPDDVPVLNIFHEHDNVPTNSISHEDLADGMEMVDFHNEMNFGRYYTRESFESLLRNKGSYTGEGKLKNPYTSQVITEIRPYIARLVSDGAIAAAAAGGRRKKLKTRRRRM